MNFDPTISIGNIVTACTFIFTTMAAAARVLVELKLALAELKRLSQRVDHLEQKVERVSTMQQQLLDGKERMDGLDERLRSLERAAR